MITIDRAARDLLVHDIISDHETRESDVQSAFKERDQTKLQAEADRLVALAKVMASLGWEERGEQESYVLPVDEPFRDWVSGTIEHYQQDNEDNRIWAEEFEPTRHALLDTLCMILDLSGHTAAV